MLVLECEPTAILDNSTISETSRRLILHDINRETFCSGGYGVLNPILIEGFPKTSAVFLFRAVVMGCSTPFS